MSCVSPTFIYTAGAKPVNHSMCDFNLFLRSEVYAYVRIVSKVGSVGRLESATLAGVILPD